MASKLGLNLLLWTSELTKKHYPLLQTLKELGFDTAEIPVFDPGKLDVGKVKALLDQYGLDATLCGAFPKKAHLGSGSATARNVGIRFVRKLIETATKLGSDMVVGPLYSPVGYLTGKPRTATEWKNAVRCYREIAKFAEDHAVTVAVEPLNRFETYFLNTALDTRNFVQEIGSPRIGILFDTFHANIEEKNLFEALNDCDPCLAHVHISENDRGVPGTGHVDWDGIRWALRAMGYSGRLVVETFGYVVPEIARAAAIWRPLYTDADSFAVEALYHLQQRFGTRKRAFSG